jgi:DNA-binding NarL/FixJ family response regulator
MIILLELYVDCRGVQGKVCTMSEAKVLIVENDLEFTTDLRTEIQKYPYQVMVAASKLEAQRTVRSDQPDIIVLGTISPRGDAFHFHQWLKRSENYSSIPLIVIDASPDEQLTRGWSKDEGLRLEAEGYFCKPIEPSALLPFIHKLTNRASKRIKVLVVDDYALVREGIRILLNLQNDMEVVGEAVDGKDAVIKTRKLVPDVVLMDIVMPGMNGFEATRKICKECKNAKVLMLTQYYSDEYVRESEQAGAFGVIPKESASAMLLNSIRTVSKGKSIISTRLYREMSSVDL